MTQQLSDTQRTAEANNRITNIGTSAQIRLFTGAIPANVAAAETGTLIVQFTGNATQFGTAATGVITTSAVANAAASAGGSLSPGYYRIRTSGGTAIAQGVIYQSTPLTTNALTAANGNVLNFAATTGVVVGMMVSGTGIIAGSRVLAVTGTTVTLDRASTAGVANTTVITFGGDMTIDNATITAAQNMVFNPMTMTIAGA